MDNFYYDYYTFAFYSLKICANEKGVILIKFVKKTKNSKPNEITKKAIAEIDRYFKGNLKVFSFPVYLNLKGFQKIVLEYIKKIPYGKTQSYKEVAKKIGKEKAYRAVGQVLKRNPLPLYFPCHRIIKTDGSLGGFAGGLKLKENLLKLEGFKINEPYSKFV